MPVEYGLSPERTALLVIDMENDWVQEGGRCEMKEAREIIPQLARLISSCRDSGVLVIYTKHVLKSDGTNAGPVRTMFPNMFDENGAPWAVVEGTYGSEIYEPIRPIAKDVVITKSRFNAFIGTGLHDLLLSRGIDTIVVTGVATNGCCEATARYAADCDFRVVFVADCTATSAMPDLGWGSVASEQAQQYTLTTLAFSIGEVINSDQIIARISYDRGKV